MNSAGRKLFVRHILLIQARSNMRVVVPEMIRRAQSIEDVGFTLADTKAVRVSDGTPSRHEAHENGRTGQMNVGRFGLVKQDIAPCYWVAQKVLSGTDYSIFRVILHVMVITHHGGQCFKVTFGDLTLVFDPIGKGGTLPAVRFGADIALVSRNHPDMNGVQEVSFGGKEPFAILGPGEYEQAGVTIQGFLTKSEYALAKGAPEAMNTVYAVKLEGMTLVHLGALAEPQLSQEAREAIDDIDVLFVPVGGDGVLDAAGAAKLATLLEPKIIIPMHWSGMGHKDALKDYIKEEGGESETMDKLTLKKKDTAEKEGAIIVLTP